MPTYFAEASVMKIKIKTLSKLSFGKIFQGYNKNAWLTGGD